MKKTWNLRNLAVLTGFLFIWWIWWVVVFPIIFPQLNGVTKWVVYYVGVLVISVWTSKPFPVRK